MRDWFEAAKAHPSGVLLVAQLIAVLAYPFAGDTPIGRTVIGVFGLMVLAVAIYAVRATPALTWVALSLGLPVVALTIAEGLAPDNQQVRLWSAILHAAFYGYTAYGLVKYLFDDSWVTRDEIFAVGANFTVVAWAFAYAFVAVQVVWPGSFVSYAGEGVQNFPALLFLSFATLTSVGLSDVVPVLPHARSVALIEQVVGVMYVAMIIARVTGLTVMNRR